MPHKTGCGTYTSCCFARDGLKSQSLGHGSSQARSRPPSGTFGPRRPPILRRAVRAEGGTLAPPRPHAASVPWRGPRPGLPGHDARGEAYWQREAGGRGGPVRPCPCSIAVQRLENPSLQRYEARSAFGSHEADLKNSRQTVSIRMEDVDPLGVQAASLEEMHASGPGLGTSPSDQHLHTPLPNNKSTAETLKRGRLRGHPQVAVGLAELLGPYLGKEPGKDLGCERNERSREHVLQLFP